MPVTQYTDGESEEQPKPKPRPSGSSDSGRKTHAAPPVRQQRVETAIARQDQAVDLFGYKEPRSSLETSLG